MKMLKLFKLFKLFVVLLFLFCTVLAFPNDGIAQQLKPELNPLVDATVVWISDADTIKVKLNNGITTQIRLSCIDSPEIPHTKSTKSSTNPTLVSHYNWGYKAFEKVRELIPPKSKIQLRVTSSDFRYGRTVAEVYSNGEMLQEKLLQLGLTQLYDEYASQCSDKQKLVNLQQIAIANKAGIWGDSSYVSPSSARKIVTNLEKSVRVSVLPVSNPVVVAVNGVEQKETLSMKYPCVLADCNCSDFKSRDAAQQIHELYPQFGLDRNLDGIACNNLK